MKKLLCTILSLTLLLTGCTIGNGNIRIGAAGIGGMYYTFANTLAGLCTKEDTGFELEVKKTAGSAANLRLLSSNYIELGIAQADLIDAAYQGTGVFTGKKYQNFKAVASLYPEACQIVVRKDSDIETIDDLQGKKVSVGEEESGSELNARQILEMSGLPEDLIKTKHLDYTDAADKLAAGKIDAFFFTAGAQTTVVEELAKHCDIRLLNLDDKLRGKLTTAYPFYSDYTIPAGTYTGQEEDIQTVRVQSILVASDALDNATVKKLTKTIFAHQKGLQYATSVDLQLNESSAIKGVPIPFHPGAAAYYSERGINVKTE